VQFFYETKHKQIFIFKIENLVVIEMKEIFYFDSLKWNWHTEQNQTYQMNNLIVAKVFFFLILICLLFSRKCKHL
jgi:hypothetical protein